MDYTIDALHFEGGEGAKHIKLTQSTLFKKPNFTDGQEIVR
jgi:hypothetical protein